MARNGTRRVGFLDLGDAGAVRSEAVLRRYVCRVCGLHDEDDGPALRSGFRMTPALFERIGAEAVLLPMSEVAARNGIDRGTVRSVWSAWIRERRAFCSRPRNSVLRRFEGTGAVLASNAEGRLAAAFAGSDDPHLRAWLSGREARVEAEVDLVADIVSLGMPDLEVGIRRIDAAAWAEARIPGVLEKAVSWFGRGERRALARGRGALILPHVLRTDAEDALLADVFRECPRLREVERGLAGLRRIFASADGNEARVRHAAWSVMATGFSKDVFRETASGLARVADRLFRPSWADRDAWYPATDLRVPKDAGSDDPARFAGRLLALNHDAFAPSVLGLDLGPTESGRSRQPVGSTTPVLESTTPVAQALQRIRSTVATR